MMTIFSSLLRPAKFPRWLTRRTWSSILAMMMLMVGLGGWMPSAQAATCSLTVSPLTFGPLGFLSTSVDTSSSMVISCQKGSADASTTVQVCPLIGASGAGGFGGNRTLTSSLGNPTVRYGLYSDAARSTTWGDATNQPYPSYSMDLSSGNMVSQTVTVYGRVFSGQAAVGGDTYHDSPAVSLAYGYSSCTIGTMVSQGALMVTATQPDSCTLSVLPMSFGSLGLLQSNADGASSVQTQCTNGTAYTVAFGNGNGAGATAAARLMTSGGDALTYALYTDTARSIVWGDGQVMRGTGTGSTASLPVYGRIPAQVLPPPGTYQDQVVVTISY